MLELLQDVAIAAVAKPDEVRMFIDRPRLHGKARKGLGYVDVHLLVSVALTMGVSAGRLQRAQLVPGLSGDHEHRQQVGALSLVFRQEVM